MSAISQYEKTNAVMRPEQAERQEEIQKAIDGGEWFINPDEIA